MPRLRPTLLLAICALLGACDKHSTLPAATRDPQALSIQGALANRYVRTNGTSQIVAQIAIEARPVERKERPPVNLALVIDTSGSMEGRAIEDARTASLALVDSLTPKDRLAIVVFNSKTEVLLPSTRLDDADLKDVRERLKKMPAEGTTDMASGLQAGVNEVAKNLDVAGVNRVLLMGDGVPNNDSSIRATAQAAGDRGISITALGLGPDYNETLMGTIAQASGGRFHYIDDSSKVATFFKEEVIRTQNVYAKNTMLELSPGPGVTVVGVVGQELARVGSSVFVNLGDVSLGDRRELIVRLETQGHRDGAPVELMDAVLKFNEGLGGAAVEKRLFIGAHATGDETTFLSGRNEAVEVAVTKMKAAADTLEAIRKARESDNGHPKPQPPAPRADFKHMDRSMDRSPVMPSPVAAPEAAISADMIRKQHDEAFQVLQGH